MCVGDKCTCRIPILFVSGRYPADALRQHRLHDSWDTSCHWAKPAHSCESPLQKYMPERPIWLPFGCFRCRGRLVETEDCAWAASKPTTHIQAAFVWSNLAAWVRWSLSVESAWRSTADEKMTFGMSKENPDHRPFSRTLRPRSFVSWLIYDCTAWLHLNAKHHPPCTCFLHSAYQNTWGTVQ